MKTLTRNAIPLTLAFAVAACAAADEATNDPAADAAAITAVRVAEGQAAEAGNAEAYLALLTDDVVVMPGNEPPFTGKVAAREWLDEFAEQFEIVFDSYVTDEIEVSGDLAYERYTGVWTVTPRAGGDPVTEHLKGIHIYHRQADGSWLIARDVWNSSDPLPEM